MKKTAAKPRKANSDDMRAEYDFSGAVRGKHYKPLHEGYSVYVRKADGTTIVQHFKLDEGTVMLEPDVREYFPDSEAVNTALRCLITLMSEVTGKSGGLARKVWGANDKRRVARSHAKSVKS